MTNQSDEELKESEEIKKIIDDMWDDRTASEMQEYLKEERLKEMGVKKNTEPKKKLKDLNIIDQGEFIYHKNHFIKYKKLEPIFEEQRKALQDMLDDEFEFRDIPHLMRQEMFNRLNILITAEDLLEELINYSSIALGKILDRDIDEISDLEDDK